MSNEGEPTELDQSQAFANTRELTDALTQSEASLALLDRISPREVIDSEGFVRTEFSVPDNATVTVLFRGREELPSLERSTSTVTALVSPDERPHYTSEDDFAKWKAELAEPPKEQGADKLRLIATATPLGVVETAIKLGESGAAAASSQRIDQLKELEKRLEASEVDDEIANLLDQIFAATAVRDGRNGIEPNEQGLMEVVLSLLGDEDAAAAVLAKQEIVKGLDKERDELVKQERGLKTDLKQSGEQLSDKEIELLENEHLVAVHTTAVQPGYLDGGDSGVRVVRPDESTIHWSLNHPTRSLSGSLGSRPVTIVAPIEDIVTLNGAPAVIDGFDTFYTEGPGEVMLIPETALILEMVGDPEAQAVEVVGSTLKLKAADLHATDLSQILDVIARTYMPDNREQALSVLSEDFLKYDGGSFDSFLTGIALDHKHGRDDSKLDDSETKAYLEQKDELEGLLQQLNPNQIHFSELEQNEQQRIFNELIQKLFTEPGMVENYPYVQKILAEALRQEIVRLQINKLGGKNVEAAAASSAVNDTEFNNAVKEVATALGLGTGLHQFRPEKELIRQSGQAVQYATEYIDGPEGRAAAGFDWATYTEYTTPIWDSMLEASVATRRQAVSRGLLPQARQKPTAPSTPSGSVWG